MDNATPHRPKLTKSCVKPLRLREADHPPYSLDLGSSGFHLFGTLKEQMAGSEFESTANLLGMIKQLTNAIARGELESVFKNGKEDWRDASELADTTFREENALN
jgi:hypothetical protein